MPADKTTSNRPSPLVIHRWRVCVGIFIVPRTGCALGERERKRESVCAMNINPATEGKASYVNADETNELPPPYSLVSRGEGGRWYPDNGAPTYLPAHPPSRPRFPPYPAFINGKKSARRASMVLLVVEKARILSPPIRARHSAPSSRRVGKRRDSLTTAEIRRDKAA